MRSDWRDGERSRAVELTTLGPGRVAATIDGAPLEVTFEPTADGRLLVSDGERAFLAEVTVVGTRHFVRLGELDFVLERESGGKRRARAGSAGLESPMPGVVTRVMAQPGDMVVKGQPLLAIEAMKMEHVIRAPHDGRVHSLAARVGEMVASGVALAEIDRAGG